MRYMKISSKVLHFLTPFRYLESIITLAFFVVSIPFLNYFLKNKRKKRSQDGTALVILQHGINASSNLNTHPAFDFFYRIGEPYDKIFVVNPFAREAWQDTEIALRQNQKITTIGFSKIGNGKLWKFNPFLNFFELLSFYNSLTKIVYEFNYDEVHFRAMTHNWVGLISVFAAKANVKNKSIIEIRGNYDLLNELHGETVFFRNFRKNKFFSRKTFNLDKYLLKMMFEKTDIVVARNINNADHALAYVDDQKKIFLNRIEIFPELWDRGLGYSRKRPPDGLRFDAIFVSRLSHEKYPFDVVESWIEVLKEFPTAKLCVVGDGPLLLPMKKYVEQWNLSENIFIVGGKTQNEAISLLDSAAFGIETYGGSTLAEKALSGCPIIAYDIEWHSEIVIQNVSGILVRFRNIPELTNAICRLISHPELRTSLRNEMLTLALNEFNLEGWRKREALIVENLRLNG